MANKYIKNFQKHTPDVPQYSDRNQNYLIAGANPTYYLDTSGTQEEQFAPLAASPLWTLIPTSLDGNIVHIITSIDSTMSVYFVTDTTHVYAIDTSYNLVDLGYPTGGSISNTGCRLAIMGSYLFFTQSASGQIWKMPLPSGVWSNFSGLNSLTGPHIMEPFANFIAVCDGKTSPGTSQVVRKIDPVAFTVTSDVLSLDIGSGWSVNGIRNYNNKYLAIAASQTTLNVSGYPSNYIFLWDGISSRYNQSVKINGKYIDMRVINGVLYVAVKVSNNKTSLYYLAGTQLKYLYTPQVSKINSFVWSAVPSSIFDYRGAIGIKLDSNSDVNYPIEIFNKQLDTNFIHTRDYNFDQFAIGFNGEIFANTYVLGGASKIYFYNDSAPEYQTITYKSHWVPVKNLSRIDIEYDTPPQSGTDAIHVTLDGRGEDIISGNSTTPLADITPSTILNTTRTPLQISGFTGDRARITLTTTNSTWRPIIRKIGFIEK